MCEIWKDIPGWEGKYMISDLGRVKSLNYQNTNKEGLKSASDNGTGYYSISFK